MRPLRMWFLILAMLSPLNSRAQSNDWPTIQNVRETHTFIEPGRGKDTAFLAFIKDVAGVPAYKVECHNVNYEDESEINFSGDFQCALFAVKGNALTSGDLLATNTKDEQSADWWNRGRMRSAQLEGKCLAYPEYSTVRHFKLRGIRLTLQFSDIGWSAAKDQQGNPLLAKFTFALDVTQDKTAQSSTAEKASGPEPPKSCYP